MRFLSHESPLFLIHLRLHNNKSSARNGPRKLPCLGYGSSCVDLRLGRSEAQCRGTMNHACCKLELDLQLRRQYHKKVFPLEKKPTVLWRIVFGWIKSNRCHRGGSFSSNVLLLLDETEVQSLTARDLGEEQQSHRKLVNPNNCY